MSVLALLNVYVCSCCLRDVVVVCCLCLIYLMWLLCLYCACVELLLLFSYLIVVFVFVRLWCVSVAVFFVFESYYNLFTCVALFLPIRDAPPCIFCVVGFVCLGWPLLRLSVCSLSFFVGCVCVVAFDVC